MGVGEQGDNIPEQGDNIPPPASQEMAEGEPDLGQFDWRGEVKADGTEAADTAPEKKPEKKKPEKKKGDEPAYRVTQIFGKNAHEDTDFFKLDEAELYYAEVKKPDFSYIKLACVLDGEDEEMEADEFCPDDWRCETCGKGKMDGVKFALDDHFLCVGCFHDPPSSQESQEPSS